mmetsp:Transcript_11824/g.47720  ORF Transcript_11824/g.47720 Transcript_11824/m.47720 type:complete len:271 (-) Transcript_11824:2627-3439(-)
MGLGDVGELGRRLLVGCRGDGKLFLEASRLLVRLSAARVDGGLELGGLLLLGRQVALELAGLREGGLQLLLLLRQHGGGAALGLAQRCHLLLNEHELLLCGIELLRGGGELLGEGGLLLLPLALLLLEGGHQLVVASLCVGRARLQCLERGIRLAVAALQLHELRLALEQHVLQLAHARLVLFHLCNERLLCSLRTLQLCNSRGGGRLQVCHLGLQLVALRLGGGGCRLGLGEHTRVHVLVLLELLREAGDLLLFLGQARLQRLARLVKV